MAGGKREIDPAEVSRVSRAPDDVRYFQLPAVFKQRIAISHTCRLPHALDTGRHHVPSPHPRERNAPGWIEKVVAKLSSYRRPHREPCRDQPYERREQAIGNAPGARRLLARVRTRQPDLVM